MTIIAKTRLICALCSLCLSACGFSLKAVPDWDVALTEAEWAAPDIIRIPFTLTGTLITVRGRIDTLEGNFFFDTGASHLILNHRHFSSRSRLAQTAAAGVTGQVRVLGSLRVDTLICDNLVATGLKADLIDLSHLEDAKKIDLVGLMGAEVFRDFEVLFDYAASRIVLIRIDKKGQPATPLPDWEYQAVESFPIEMAGHIAVLKMRFGASALLFALDSGAEQNLLGNDAGKRFLKENFEIRKRLKLRGAGRASIEVLSGVLRNARLDSIAFEPMNTLLTNLAEINAAYKTSVQGVLGYEFLSQRPVSINPRKKRLTFYRAVRP